LKEGNVKCISSVWQNSWTLELGMNMQTQFHVYTEEMQLPFITFVAGV
jgi:hypothetical protein